MSESRKPRPLRLAGLLSAIAPNRVFLAVLLGSLAGFAYALVIPLVLRSVQQSTLAHNIEHIFDPTGEGGHYHLFGVIDLSTPRLALAFLLLCLFILVTRATSQSLLARTAVDAIVELRSRLYRRIARTSIQDLERIGSPRLLNALNSDVQQVVRGAAVYPGLFGSVATLIGLLGFLVFLNLQVFVFLVGMIVFGALTYQIPVRFGRRFLTRARASLDRIQEGMRGLIYGAKELKINRGRRQAFVGENLEAIETEFRTAQKRGETLMIFGMTYGDLISFFAIGVVTYALANYYSMSRDSLIGVVMVMLYVTAPIVTLLNAVAPIVQGSVAAARLQALLKELPEEPSVDSTMVQECTALRLQGVAFKYNEQARFRVGPLDLTLQRGEVTFLVGGNGSGKTTLGKLLSLHYLPQEGEVYFDAEPVAAVNRDACRQSVSAIYSDFHLFAKLSGVTRASDAQRQQELIQGYLKDLELDSVVSMQGDAFSSTALSDGQKKRLALLVVLLEDRPIYVFDEWASDQDPVFKNIFYHQVLPSLRRMNKLVVVITHDDRYFHLADRILKMENGTILTDQRRAANEAGVEAEQAAGPLRVNG